MSCHRIDLAIHEGMLAVITLSLGRSLEGEEALLLREDVLDRLQRVSGRPAALLIDLRSLFEVDAEALEMLNSLEERARRFANVVDINHVVRMSDDLELIAQAQLAQGHTLAPIFTTCSEAVGFLTGQDEGFEASVA